MLMGIAVVIPFAIGEAVLGIEAYLIREWQILQIVAYLPIACKNKIQGVPRNMTVGEWF